MGSTAFRIPSDVINPEGEARGIYIYTSSGILKAVDPLASASNLYLECLHKCEWNQFIVSTKS